MKMSLRKQHIALFHIILSKIASIFCNWLSINSQVHLQTKICTMANPNLLYIHATVHQRQRGKLQVQQIEVGFFTSVISKKKKIESRTWPFSLQKIISTHCLLQSYYFVIDHTTHKTKKLSDRPSLTAKISYLKQNYKHYTSHLLSIKQEIF